MRRLTTELRPPALDDFGLQPALERLTELVAGAERARASSSTCARRSSCPPEYETALYRIIQEALTNIVKHAEAHSVSIIVLDAEGAVRTVIEDDGAGFDPSTVRDGALGLVGMRERVSLLDGRFDVESARGAGTTLIIELPLP